MRQSKVFRISKEEYKKAGKFGAESIIGKHEKNVTNAEVIEMGDGSYWLSYESERDKSGE